jgi:fatty acid desaturase
MQEPHTLPPIDYEGFARELEALRKDLEADIGMADYQHLRKLESWGKICSALGYSTAWLFPNPLSAALISQGIVTRWAMVTHHVSHRGYDRIKNIPARYHSRTFASGHRRWIDWFDWLVPAAWNFEHNTLHHYHTGEVLDPDVLEDRVYLMRHIQGLQPVKNLIALLFMATWKFSYYAPNTLWMLQQMRKRKEQGKASGVSLESVMTLENTRLFHGVRLWMPFSKPGLEFWGRCLLPYAVGRFALVPLLFLPLGRQASLNVLLTSLMAEVITNVHSFLIIVPNHSGDDVYRFDGPISDRAEFYVRQTVGSVNFTGGSDPADFLQGFLNYQIEHHLWPDMPMRKLQQAQPQVEAICRKYGVPYIREPLAARVGKMWKILVGKSTMRPVTTLSRAERKRTPAAVS